MIRKLSNTENDHYLLLAFLRSVDAEFGIPLSSKVDLKEYTSKLLNRASVLVVEEESQIQSGVMFYCNKDDSVAYEPLLGTLPQAQGHGYARRLLQEMIKECRQKGLSRILTDSINPIAVSLYHSMGFEEIGRETEDGREKVFMQYQL